VNSTSFKNFREQATKTVRMGVSMCSLSNGEKANLHEFQYDMEWDTSEEEEDTDDDNEYFNLGKMGRCMSLPDMGDLETSSPNSTNAKVRSQSFHENMKVWHRSSVVSPEAELQAKCWSNMVANDTLKHLSHTVRIASSTVETGVAINNELSRQDEVLSRAETDLSISKYETEQVAETLRGMRSLRSKVKNVMWKKSPKLKINEFDSKTSSFSNVKLELFEEDVTSCSISNMECKTPSSSPNTSEDIQQIQIKTRLGQLHNALDIMAVQQMNVAWALDTQKTRFNIFEDQLTRTNEKINRQRRMIRICGKL